jgi:hypothetical protein
LEEDLKEIAAAANDEDEIAVANDEDYVDFVNNSKLHRSTC